MTNPSDRPPPYIPRWGQEFEEPRDDMSDMRQGLAGFDEPANDDRYPLGASGRLPLPRSLDPKPVPDWPRQTGQPPRRRKLAGKIVRYSLTFGLAAAATLVVVLMLGKPATQDVPTQNAGTAFTTRFRGESEPQTKVASAMPGQAPATVSAPVAQIPAGPARAPATDKPAAPDSSNANLTTVPTPTTPSVAPAASAVAALPPPAQTQQLPPPRTAAPALGREEVDILFSQGEGFVAVGDFASARVVFRRAAESRDARAALALGATYDPILLARMGAKGITPDLAQAREWYTRAREYGSAEAASRLQALANLR